MVWVVKLEEVIEGKVISRRKVTALNRPEHINDLDDLGLRLEDGMALVAELQALVVERQFEHDQEKRSTCTHCGAQQRLKDYRPRKFDTVFGRVSVRRARFECVRCKEDGVVETAPEGLRGRSTPELDALRAKWAAHLPYRVVRNMLCELLPVSGGVTHTTIRNHTLAAGERIEQRMSEEGTAGASSPAPSLTLGLDTAQ